MSTFHYSTDIFKSAPYESYVDELWKTVPNFTRYEASTFGRLRNKKTRNLMSERAIDGGYVNNSLINDQNVEKKCKRHRIIAMTFLPNIHNKPTVNHKNHKRNDNRLFNLEYATMEEQVHH